MEQGGAAWETTLAKLRGARCVIVVLSTNFKASRYFLEELCVKRRDIILPIFLDRDPAQWDGALLLSTFGTLCAEEPSTYASEVERWRIALGASGVEGIGGLLHKRDTECVLLTPSC